MFVSFLLQLINYLTCSTMFLVPKINQMYKEMKKIPSISQQSSVYCWIRIQTRKRRWISGFCRSIFFLAYNFLGSVGRSETYIFFLALQQFLFDQTYQEGIVALFDFYILFLFLCIKWFEHEFCTCTPNSNNQNLVSSIYNECSDWLIFKY